MKLYYSKAVFKGAEFYVSSHELSGGRRGQTHQFPDQDVPQVEDLGKKARKYTIDGYVFGDNYFTDKNNLIKVCEDRGAGTLVHPYLGILGVICRTYRIRETVRETRICRFTMEMDEVGITVPPLVTADTLQPILSARLKALRAINNFFLKAYSVIRKPYNKLLEVQETLQVGFTAVENARKIVGSVDSYKDEIDKMKMNIGIIYKNVVKLAESTLEILTFGTLPTDDDFQLSSDNAMVQFREMKKLFDFEAPIAFTEEDDPSVVFSQLLSYSAIAIAGGVTSIIPYSSIEEAETIEKELFDKIDSLLSDINLDHNIYLAFRDLKAQINTDIQQRGTQIPKVLNIELMESVSALVLSYDIYGTIDKEEEIINRNKIKHPGFIPSGQLTEVLIDVE